MNAPTLLFTGILVCALTFGAAACGSDGEPTAAEASDDPIVALGAEVYQQSCASCHGPDLRGTDKGPSHLSIVYEPNHHSDDSFRSAIANGDDTPRELGHMTLNPVAVNYQCWAARRASAHIAADGSIDFDREF